MRGLFLQSAKTPQLQFSTVTNFKIPVNWLAKCRNYSGVAVIVNVEKSAEIFSGFYC